MKNAEKKYEQYMKSISEDDLVTVSSTLNSMNRGKIKAVWDDVQLLFNMVKEKELTGKAYMIALAGLVYLVSPVDAVPDTMPFIGLADDLFIITQVVKTLSDPIENYKEKQIKKLEQARKTRKKLELKKNMMLAAILVFLFLLLFFKFIK